jgi:hypothetical protein
MVDSRDMTLEKLQKNLDGVYDLRDTADCHAMIRFLLRDLDGSKAREKQAREKLKSLAASVLSDSFDAKEKARNVLSASGGKEDSTNAIKFILRMGEMMKAAEDMTNEQLSEEVLDKVWANLDMSSRESAVLGEMMARFKEEPKGANVVPGARNVPGL